MDADLAALASQHTCHVITRNSHKDAIGHFLRQRGVRVASVVVVRKGASKADAIRAILPSLAPPHAAATDGSPSPTAPDAKQPISAVFVDDSIGEVCDKAVAALPGLFRVLFRRGAVV